MCDKWLRDAGMELHIDMEFDTSDSIKRVIAAGNGAAILHKNSVAVEVAAGLLKVLEVDLPPMSVQVALTARPRQRFSPAARAFLQELVAGLQEEGLVEVLDVDAINRFVGITGSGNTGPLPPLGSR
jgi:DNA-binding transcriptional LysR family regulator